MYRWLQELSSLSCLGNPATSHVVRFLRKILTLAFVILAVGALGCDGMFVLSGCVKDEKLHPIPNATLTVVSIENSFPELEGKTDALGQFWIETAVSPSSKIERIQLMVESPGFARTRMTFRISNFNKDMEIVLQERQTPEESP